MTTTLVAVATSQLPFVVASTDDLAKSKKPLTLSAIAEVTDAVDQAQARADAAFRKASQPFGNDGTTPWLRATTQWGDFRQELIASNGAFAGGCIVALACGAAAGLGVGQFIGPAAMVPGLAVFGGVGFGLLHAGEKLIRKAADKIANATLEASHLHELREMHSAAAGGPLERTGIGRAAQAGLEALKKRQIFSSDATRELLTAIAADALLGTEESRAADARRANLLYAARALDNAPGRDKRTEIQGLMTAFSALASDERRELAPQLLGRYFYEVSPRSRMNFEAANELREALSKKDD